MTNPFQFNTSMITVLEEDIEDKKKKIKSIMSTPGFPEWIKMLIQDMPDSYIKNMKLP